MFVLIIYSINKMRSSLQCGYLISERTTPITRLPDDEDSFPVLYDRELHSLHRNIPALRRRDVDTNTIKQHYYPEGNFNFIMYFTIVRLLEHLVTSLLNLIKM